MTFQWRYINNLLDKKQTNKQTASGAEWLWLKSYVCNSLTFSRADQFYKLLNITLSSNLMTSITNKDGSQKKSMSKALQAISRTAHVFVFFFLRYKFTQELLTLLSSSSLDPRTLISHCLYIIQPLPSFLAPLQTLSRKTGSRERKVTGNNVEFSLRCE